MKTKRKSPAKRKSRGTRKANPPRHAAKRANSGWKLRQADGLQVLEAPALQQLKWLTHGFSTRPGGASAMKSANGEKRGPTKAGKVLNLGFTDWDDRSMVLENRGKFFGAIGAEGMRAVVLRQVHSDIIHRVDSSNPVAIESWPQGDALITNEPGILLTIQTADCIPILLADPENRAIAAIHAGWRGTVRRIAAKALGRMQMEFGTKPEDVIVALGPGIGRCCYEVGPDVAKEFADQFPEARDWFDGQFEALSVGDPRDADPNWLPWLTMKPPGHAPEAPKLHLDLIAANRAILAAAGIPPANIASSEHCTACRTDLFFSYRRERETGRMMAAIGIDL
jgi:YfiH family protein